MITNIDKAIAALIFTGLVLLTPTFTEGATLTFIEGTARIGLVAFMVWLIPNRR